jgi:hypothetical protein
MKKGGDGLISFLTWAATKHTPSFLPLLGRVMPLQVETKEYTTAPAVFESAEEIRAELRRPGIPIDRNLPTDGAEPTGADAE